MPLSHDAEQVLRDIFAVGSDRALAIGNRLRAPTPGPNELFDLCEMLATVPNEEALQKFLETHFGFMTGLLGGPDNSDLAVLFKPKIGTQFVADFCVLQAHQGGAVAHMIEIETSHAMLFTKKGNPAKRLAGALNQLEDWRIEIDRQPKFYSGELLRMAQSLDEYDEASENSRGVRFAPSEKIKRIWDAFGGGEQCFWTYTAILGRWSKLNTKEKTRIVHRNQSGPVKIHTFEQLARNANFRLERDDWHNDLDEWDWLSSRIVGMDPLL